MLALAGGLVWGVAVDPGWSAIGFGLLLGGSAGAIRTLEAAAFPRYFGTTHLGSIRGVVAAVSVGSTAFGPVAFALVHDATGGYTVALLASAVLPLLVAAAALGLPTPRPLDDAAADRGSASADAPPGAAPAAPTGRPSGGHCHRVRRGGAPDDPELPPLTEPTHELPGRSLLDARPLRVTTDIAPPVSVGPSGSASAEQAGQRPAAAVVASCDTNVTNGSPLNPDVTGEFRQTVPDAIDAARAHR